MHICHLAFSGSTALAYRSCDQHTKLRGSQRLVQTGSTSNATHQESSKLLKASDGTDITYQQEQMVDYEEVSLLLEKRQESLRMKWAFAVSDGAFNAQIWDVIIDPAFQEKGLGKQLIEEIVRYLIALDIKNITTFAEKGGSKFYEKVGFQSDPDGVRGMFWRQLQ